MTYFVRINEPVAMRKRVLESSKDLLHSLKSYHELLEIRDQKKETAEALSDTMGELARLCAQLEKLMPEKSLKEVEEFLPKAPKKAKKAKKSSLEKAAEEAPAPVDSATEAERLERALANINERLSKL